MAELGEELTEREIELLQMVATGITNREVAHKLSISVNTVKVHLRNIYTKLGAESRTEATMIAVREGWVTVEGLEEPDGEAGLQAEGQRGAPIIIQPPLPWPKRVALIAALLLVVSGLTITWPRERSEAGNALGLPPDLAPEQITAAETETGESPWREQAQMPTRRAYFALVAAQERLFAIGGQTSEGATAAVEIYDPESNIWTRGSAKPRPVAYVSAVVLGSDIYVPGGCDDEHSPIQAMEVYEISTDVWREASPLPDPRCAYALTSRDDKLYLFGGWDGQRYVATVLIYDPESDTWSTGTPMNSPRGLAAAATTSRQIYVVGGYDGKQELTQCSIYDSTQDTWEDCAPLIVGRGGLGLVNLSDQVYAIGGGGWTSYLGFNERYSPEGNRWQAIDTPMIGTWRSPGVAVLGTSIYAIGGWNNDYLSLNQSYTSFRVFIPISQY
ncbi:MAG TPA: helix-turn-helix domain-containing protein [Chloroflexi bacterium]|nr:helix-turn-helix domain-containing protein [Chloroflexota bacterium]